MRVNFAAGAILGEAIVMRTESESRPGLFHYTFKLRRAGIICTCEAWQYRASCKHALNMPLDSPEALKIEAQWRKQDREEAEAKAAPPFERYTERAGGPDPHDMH